MQAERSGSTWQGRATLFSSAVLAPNSKISGLPPRGLRCRARPQLCAPLASKLCGSRGPTRSPVRPCLRQLRRPGRGASCGRSGGGDQRVLLSTAPRLELRASRTGRARPAAPGSGISAPPRPPGVFAQRGDPSLRGLSGASVAPAARPPREPLARGARSPGLPGLSVLRAALPPSLRVCLRRAGAAGAAGAGDERGGGGDAERGAERYPVAATGAQPARREGAAAAPSQARERAPQKPNPCARPRAPGVSGTHRRAVVRAANVLLSLRPCLPGSALPLPPSKACLIQVFHRPESPTPLWT
nr:collagen alpha-1(III) chain-like [Peromyscus maniculatus bairdii]